MLFNSFNFWLIFPIIFCLYWLIPQSKSELKKGLLIIVSYLLYMNWKPVYALILFGVTVITFWGARLLDNASKWKKKKLCFLFLCLGFLPLVLFKYYNFINDNVSSLLVGFGLSFSLPGLNWAIPVGISFFTFQCVGYMLDVYFEKVRVERNFVDYLLFSSFFPQTTSGPISRYSDLMPQIKKINSFDPKHATDGLKILLCGILLKVVIADRLGVYVDLVYGTYVHQSSITCMFAAMCYSLQIYCDFAGYSMMAVGIAKNLGFDLVNNFNHPYLSASVTEFWKRWHISLTRWLTNYVYIPLGGNRCSKAKQYLNILVTFLVSGIWHGANWTFIVWGVLHGLFQIVEKFFWGDKLKQELKQDSPKSLSLKLIFRMIGTFFLVSFAWIFFRMPTLDKACGYILHIFTSDSKGFFAPQPDTTILLFLAILLIVFYDVVNVFLPKYNPTKSNNVIVRWTSYVIVVVWILLSGVFDSSNFIYANF